MILILNEKFRKDLNWNVEKELNVIKNHLDSDYVKKEYEKCLKKTDVQEYIDSIKDLFIRVRGLFYI